MGTGTRVRRAYRVLRADRCRGVPALGVATWRVLVDPMSAAMGRDEIAAGVRHWSLRWDRRGKDMRR